jgi:RimJ/RimL family protein N-acetyltransferase
VLHRCFADANQDRDEFAAFSCWDGDPGAVWAEEAENYVRGWVLGQALHTLAFREEDGALLAVSAFDPRVIAVPLLEPIEQPAWHLQCVAVRLEDQGRGLSEAIFRQTLSAMREMDPDRILVTANVHKRNLASLRACEKAGFSVFRSHGHSYVELLGEVTSP